MKFFVIIRNNHRYRLRNKSFSNKICLKELLCDTQKITDFSLSQQMMFINWAT